MTVRMRPRFEIEVALEREAVLGRMRARLDQELVRWHVALLNDQIEVSPHNQDLHFWSPYLKVRLEDNQHGNITLRGVFGPNINLWTFLLAIYAVCGLLGATGLLVAFSQWQLDVATSGLLLTSGCSLIASMVWIAAQIGQRFAQEQMQGIHAFIVETYEGAITEDNTEVTSTQQIHQPSPPDSRMPPGS